MRYLPRLQQGELRTAPAIARTHLFLQRRFPRALWIGHPAHRRVALTFDDGPHPRDTEALLDVLDHHRVRATFFHIGRRAAEHPALVRAVYDAGHDLGIHGYEHRAFPLIPAPTLHDHLRRAADVLAQASGTEPAQFRYVRPPFGWFTPAILRSLQGWNLRPVMWTVVPVHWLQTSTRTYRDVVRETCDGALLVLHESLSGPAVAHLCDGILNRLEDQGFEFTTVDDLWRTTFQGADGD